MISGLQDWKMRTKNTFLSHATVGCKSICGVSAGKRKDSELEKRRGHIKNRAKMKVLRLWDCPSKMQLRVEGARSEGPLPVRRVLGLSIKD